MPSKMKCVFFVLKVSILDEGYHALKVKVLSFVSTSSVDFLAKVPFLYFARILDKETI